MNAISMSTGALMVHRFHFTARLAPILLATGLLGTCLDALAQAAAHPQSDDAWQLAQSAAERAQRARDDAQRVRDDAQRARDDALRAREDALRDADEAIQALDLDNMASLGFMTHELGGAREIVKNAPYTAEAVTETIQMLTDGNRIVHKSVTLLARDSLGRTRQEKKGERGGMVYLYDPIENRSYVLRTAGKTAVPLPRPPTPPTPPTPLTPPAPPTAVPPRTPPESAAINVQPGRVIVSKSVGSGIGTDEVHVEVVRIGRADNAAPDAPVAPIPPMPPLTLHGHPLALPYVSRDKGVTEMLGSREFDGVRADGKRTIRTIPAGAIGNEKPIAVVSERWFCPELNVVVMSRNVDPRSGETVYRLADIKRGEPPAELFKVPADYKLREERTSRGR
jgi:hypothetical protein